MIAKIPKYIKIDVVNVVHMLARDVFDVAK